MKRQSVAQAAVGFVIGAALLSQLSYMDKIIIGADPLQAKGYFVSVLFGGSAGAIISYLLRTEIAERRQAEEKLSNSQARLNSILSSMTDLVFVFDAEGCFTDCYSSAERFRSPISTSCLRGPLKVRRGKVVEYEFWLDVNGQEDWYLAKLSPMYTEGKFAGAVSVMRNITGRKQTEEALQESEEFLQQVVGASPAA